MDNIELVPIEWLEHHPDNPRKDLGDLTELADSIRANGILQNLTIVAAPADEDCPAQYRTFYVVIGNRRMEAAKLAGLKELPCVLSDMDHKTQVATMLQENMQRQDLTIYEQAQGFQMMMDLGFNEDQIAEQTGFSKTTVKRRLKMAELDPEKLKKVCDEDGSDDRQISMAEFDKLAKIDSIAERNSLLSNIGTNDFAWKFGSAYRKQEAKNVIPEVKKILKKEKINKLPDGKRYSSEYDRHYDWTVKLYEWKPGEKLLPKTKDQLFYLMDETEIEFYTKHKREAPVRKTEEEKAEEKRIAEAWEHVKADTDLARQLRNEFADKMPINIKKVPDMMKALITAAVLSEFDYSSARENLNEVLGLTEDIHYYERTKKAYEKLLTMPVNSWPRIIRCFFDSDSKHGYYEGYQRVMPYWKENLILDLYYEWLKANGYQMSETEIMLQDGTYPYFKQPDPPKTEEPEDKDDGEETDGDD